MHTWTMPPPKSATVRRTQRHPACDRKSALFVDEGAARREARATEDRLGRPRGWYTHYLCRWCGRWHVGSNKQAMHFWARRERTGPVDVTLLDAIGGRAYRHGERERLYPGRLQRWLTERIPEIAAARRRQRGADR